MSRFSSHVIKNKSMGKVQRKYITSQKYIPPSHLYRFELINGAGFIIYTNYSVKITMMGKDQRKKNISLTAMKFVRGIRVHPGLGKPTL
jgi:hypothetical protein